MITFAAWWFLFPPLVPIPGYCKYSSEFLHTQYFSPPGKKRHPKELLEVLCSDACLPFLSFSRYNVADEMALLGFWGVCFALSMSEEFQLAQGWALCGSAASLLCSRHKRVKDLSSCEHLNDFKAFE